jgi:hypothetical protein
MVEKRRLEEEELLQQEIKAQARRKKFKEVLWIVDSAPQT